MSAMDDRFAPNSESKLVATGIAESIDRQLDKEIETFIANSVSKRRSEKENQCTCSSISNLIRNKSKQLVPLVVLIGYTVYVGYALYSSPKEAVAVTVFLPLVLYICINRISKGQFSKRLNRPLKRIITRLTPRKRVQLWIRRYISAPALQNVALSHYFLFLFWLVCLLPSIFILKQDRKLRTSKNRKKILFGFIS